MGYLANFMVYTLAMVGVIAIALLVFKGSSSFGSVAKSKYLKVIDSLTIGPRKTLYVVSTGRENFLIAGDVGNTTLISKLESASKIEKLEQSEEKIVPKEDISNSFKETMSILSAKQTYIDKSNIGIKSSMLSQKQSVMRNLAERIK